MDLITTQDNAAANLPQLEARLKVRFESWTNQTLEIGRDLIAAKKLVPHGSWQNWLERNFSLSQNTAGRFMQVAERFGNSAMSQSLNQSQMFQLLSLPDAEETEKFIEAKAAEGKRVDEMTIKQLREEIADYKKQLQDKDETIAQRDATIEKQAESHQQSLFDFNAQLDERDERIGDLEKELADRPTVAPDDYDETKEALVDAKIALREAEVKAESALREEQLKSEAALREEKSKSDTALRDAKRDADIELRESQRKAQIEFDELKTQADELQSKLDEAQEKIQKLKAEKKRSDDIRKQLEQIKEHGVEQPDGLFDVIVIDPPWGYVRQAGHGSFDANGRRCTNPYPEMTQAEIKAIKLPAAADCVLFLWTTQKFIWDAKELLDTWGFDYRCTLVWNKQQMGTGNLFRMQCEFCLVALKGKPTFNDVHDLRDIIEEPRREHSRKPEAFYQLVDKLCTGRKLDYFSRTQREGWTTYGNNTNQFSVA